MHVHIDTLSTHNPITSENLPLNEKRKDDDRPAIRTTRNDQNQIPQIVGTVVQEGKEGTNTAPKQISDNIEDVNKEQRCVTPTRNPPKRFTLDSLSQFRQMHEPTVREALSSSYVPKWNSAMREKRIILEGMDC